MHIKSTFDMIMQTKQDFLYLFLPSLEIFLNKKG